MLFFLLFSLFRQDTLFRQDVPKFSITFLTPYIHLIYLSESHLAHFPHLIYIFHYCLLRSHINTEREKVENTQGING